jgi:hypothetical protein
VSIPNQQHVKVPRLLGLRKSTAEKSAVGFARGIKSGGEYPKALRFRTNLTPLWLAQTIPNLSLHHSQLFEGNTTIGSR